MTNPHGSIRRDGKSFIVSIIGKDFSRKVGKDGIECTNPGASPSKRRYIKRFFNKPIYLPNQFDRAIREHLTGDDVVVLAMNGYSNLHDDNCRAWGVRPMEYEHACARLMRLAYEQLIRRYDGVDVRFAHGAANMGVDLAVETVAKEKNRPQLGFNCPEFMFYVPDDDVPVYVARTKAEYADAFTTALNILITCNGGMHSYEMDVDAVFKKQKYVILANVLKSISTNGGPPAIGPDGNILDAVAAFEERVISLADGMEFVPSSIDPFERLSERLSNAVSKLARPIVSNARAYGILAKA